MLIKSLSAAFMLVMLIKVLPYVLAYRRLTRQGLHAPGTIQRIESYKPGIRPQRPVITFVTRDNQTISGKPVQTWQTSPMGYKPGSECKVWYDQKKPSIFILENAAEMRTNLLVLVLAVFTIGVFVAEFL